MQQPLVCLHHCPRPWDLNLVQAIRAKRYGTWWKAQDSARGLLKGYPTFPVCLCIYYLRLSSFRSWSLDPITWQDLRLWRKLGGRSFPPTQACAVDPWWWHVSFLIRHTCSLFSQLNLSIHPVNRSIPCFQFLVPNLVVHSAFSFQFPS